MSKKTRYVEIDETNSAIDIEIYGYDNNDKSSDEEEDCNPEKEKLVGWKPLLIYYYIKMGFP